MTRPHRFLTITLAGLLGALALVYAVSLGEPEQRLAGIEREGDIPLPVALS